jgi:hypothetical protein
MGPRAGLDDIEEWKSLTQPGLGLRFVSHLVRSQSLYRLSYRWDRTQMTSLHVSSLNGQWIKEMFCVLACRHELNSIWVQDFDRGNIAYKGSGKICLSLMKSVFWNTIYSPLKVNEESLRKRLLTQKIGVFPTRVVRISGLNSVLQPRIKWDIVCTTWRLLPPLFCEMHNNCFIPEKRQPPNMNAVSSCDAVSCGELLKPMHCNQDLL